jgi:hypothetical protein
VKNNKKCKRKISFEGEKKKFFLFKILDPYFINHPNKHGGREREKE